MRTRMTTAAILTTALSLGAGCGEPDSIDTSVFDVEKVDDDDDGERQVSLDEGRDPTLDGVGPVQPPPRDYYDATFAAALVKVEYGKFALTDLDEVPVVWVSFDGAAVKKGVEPTQSHLLCSPTATLPRSRLSPAERQAVVTAAQAEFDRVGIAARFTDEKPASGDHTTVYVGGAYSALGCSGEGVTGIAPFDVGDARRSDIAFVFEATILGMAGGTPQDVAKHVATQTGRAFGVQDVKTLPTVSGGALALASGPAAPGLGNLPASLANLPGLGQIATIAQLLPGLSNQQLIDISQLLPLIQQLLPSGLTGMRLPGLDKVLTVVGLVGTLTGQPAGQPPAAAVAAVGGPDITMIAKLLAAQQASTGSIQALVAGGGFADLDAAVAAAQDIINVLSGGLGLPAPAPVPAPAPAPQQPPASPAPAALTGLPNLAALLGLASGTNASPAALINNMIGSAQVINGNFKGADKDALTSLVKVAYSQAWQQVAGQSKP